MFDAVKDKAVLLMEFDQHLFESEREEAENGVGNGVGNKASPKYSKKPTQMPAVQMLVKNTEAIPVCIYL